MAQEPNSIPYDPTTGLTWGEAGTIALERMPALWAAAEALSHPDMRVRQQGWELLVGDNVVSVSPLVAYLAVTRLTEPDLLLRSQIAAHLGALLTSETPEAGAAESVRATLQAHLAQMTPLQVTALLEVTARWPELRPAVSAIFAVSPFAGDILGGMSGDRKVGLALRREALYFIGMVGFLNALPDLERLAARLDTQINGSRSLAYTLGRDDEAELLVAVQAALELLRAP
jgi:hypothetical protein